MRLDSLAPATFGLTILVVSATAAAQERLAIFDAPVVVIDDFHRIDELIDLDGDDFVDVIGAWAPTSSQLLVTPWRNDGAGGLIRLVPVEITIQGCTNCSSILLAVGDLNGDHRGDFVVSKESRVRAYLGDGAGAFSPWRDWAVNFPTDLTIGDFDGDGLDDIAVLDGFAAHVLVYLNRGTAVPFEELSWDSNYGIEHLTVAEMTGDGIDDLVGWSGSFSRLIPMSVSGGALVPGAFLEGGAVGMLAAGDVDGDGDLDLVSFGMTAYSIFRRNGPSTFAIEPIRTGGPATRLADVDADGDLDGICCAGGGDGLNHNQFASMFEISINRGAGDFAPAFRIPGLGSRRLAGAADLDHDGDVDLVAGRCIYYAHGPIVDPHPAFPRPASTRTAIDSDGDGDLDWDVEPSYALTSVGDGRCIVRTPVMPPPPAGEHWLGPAFRDDFDGDGDVDLIMMSGAAFNITLRGVWQRASLVFEDGGPCGIEWPAQGSLVAGSSFVADADGDGDLDVIASFVSGTAVTQLWLNDGARRFVLGQSISGERPVHCADFTGDGVPDLVTYNNPSTGLIRRGIGGGTFGQPETAFPLTFITPAMFALRVADLDGDGDLDVVAPDGITRLHVNDGDGHFTQTSFLPIEGFFQQCIVADFDVDGRPDVMVGPAANTSIGSLIYRAAGPPLSFDPPVTQMVVGVAVADVDGDGDPDVLSDSAANVGLYSDHAVRSNRFRGDPGGRCVQFGIALAGAGGIRPILGASGPFRTGMPHEIRIVGTVGRAHTLLAVGRTRASIPWRGGTIVVGGRMFVRDLTTSGSPGVPGVGRFTVRRAATPATLAGRTFVLQAAVRDTAAVQGYALTNGLELHFGD